MSRHHHQSPVIRALDVYSLLSSRLCVPCPLHWNRIESRMEFNSSSKVRLYFWTSIVFIFIGFPFGLGSSVMKLAFLVFSADSYTSNKHSSDSKLISVDQIYLLIGVPLTCFLCFISGIIIAFSTLHHGSELAYSFNTLLRYEKKYSFFRLYNNMELDIRTNNRPRRVIVGTCLSLIIIWGFAIMPALISFWLIQYDDVAPHGEIFKVLIADSSNHYYFKCLVFTFLFIGFTEYLRLLLLMECFFLVGPPTINSIVRGMYTFWVGNYGYLILYGNNRFVKLYNELGLITKILSAGTCTGGSVSQFVGMIVIVMLNFSTIRLKTIVPLWILVFAPMGSFIVVSELYMRMSCMADSHDNSKKLIKLWRNSSRLLVSRRFMHKTSLALRPLEFYIGFMGNTLRVIDRLVIAGYFYKILDYTVVSLLAIP
jgi:hypothetical protein